MSEDILKRARAFAEAHWDESDLPEEEKSSKDVLDLCKVCGSSGFMAGWKKAVEFMLEEQKLAWSAARDMEQIHIGGNDYIEGRHYAWLTFEDWVNRKGNNE
jgi:hypothetical protein